MGYPSRGEYFVTPFLTRYRRRRIAAFALAPLASAHGANAGNGCLRGTMPGPLARPFVCLCILELAAAAPMARGGTAPLPFAEALKIGEKVSPRLAAQGAALAAATELVPRASELPDPKLRVGVDNLPVNGADRYRYDSDFMTMRKIGVMQDFPNAEKRRLRGERAALERDVEAANLDAQRAGLRREIALAWLELYFARQARAPLVELAREMQLQLDTVSAAIAAGPQEHGNGRGAGRG